ncbi:hypothetical protein SEA_FRANKLIN22_68 [Microbacterium phage Franklin22]|uniref:hypothetical protein n=1 Tax=Microbacterium phage Franklin22 TaxID=2894293 RepID=UPI001E72726E|nr:hypothetical protein QDW15_gp68 [Microbacterium phage Franklin22]UGL61881.1 hypothetical protein SEA_FRANKLIN22_68 [Microbacterium phage Franklin22]
MPEPKFTVHDHDGLAIAGDDVLSDSLKFIAAEADGYVVQNRDKSVVYDARPVVFPGNLPDEEEPELGEAA